MVDWWTVSSWSVGGRWLVGRFIQLDLFQPLKHSCNGLVLLSLLSVDTSLLYLPFLKHFCFSSEEAVTSNSQQEGFIMVETNYRVYAYTGKPCYKLNLPNVTVFGKWFEPRGYQLFVWCDCWGEGSH